MPLYRIHRLQAGCAVQCVCTTTNQASRELEELFPDVDCRCVRHNLNRVNVFRADSSGEYESLYNANTPGLH